MAPPRRFVTSTLAIVACLAAARVAARTPQAPAWTIRVADSATGPVATAQVRVRSTSDPTHTYRFTVRCSTDSNFRDGPPNAFRVGVEAFDELADRAPTGRALPWTTVAPGAARTRPVAYRLDNGDSHPAQLASTSDNGGSLRGLVWLRIPASRLVLTEIVPGETVEIPFDSLTAGDRTTLTTACIPAGKEHLVLAGSGFAPPRKIKDVPPRYPGSPQRRLQGQVIVAAVIGPDGKVTSTKVVRGLSPDLDAAALEAVAQWEYAPTLFDGVAVSIPMTVVVTFSMR